MNNNQRLEKKENRRVKMTKLLLNQGFLQALSQKPLSRITVKEICEYADVNRSTYYVYYNDPYDQLKKLEENFILSQSEYIEELILTANENTGFANAMENLLLYYKNNKSMLRILFGEYGNMHLEYDILSYFGKYVLSHSNKESEEESETLQYYTYAASGCFGLIIYWLQNDCEEPVEKLSKRITDLTTPIRHQ